MSAYFKRIILLFTCTILILFFSITAFAENTKTYAISELDLSISVPESMVVYTRDICENEKLLEQKGYSYDSLVSYYVASNIYFNAFNPSNNQEIVVTMSDGSLNDFNILGDTTLNALADGIMSQHDDYGFTALKYDIYQHSQAKFIRVFYQDKSNSAYGLQYYTTYNRKAMNFTLRTYSDSINSVDENLIKSVVDSIKFNSEPQSKSVSESTDAFKYTDNEAGVSFTVPVNWVKKELSQSGQYFDEKFVSNVDESMSILYGSTDIWEQMSPYEKSGYSRQDIDTSYLTRQDVADIIGCSLSEVGQVSYNGESYYQIISTTDNVSGTGISVTVTVMLHIDNGWMYQFQFSGKPEHKLFSDFESLLETVSYSQSSTNSQSSTKITTPIASESTTNNYESNAGGRAIGWGLFALTIVCIIVGILIYRKNTKNTDNTTNQPVSNVSDNKAAEKTASQNQIASTRISETSECENELKNEGAVTFGTYCHKCGCWLPNGSNYCHKCGAKQIREDDEQ